MMRTVSLSSFVVLSLFAATASADPEIGWISDTDTVSQAEEEEEEGADPDVEEAPAEEAPQPESEAPPPTAKAPARKTAQTTTKQAEPERDQAPQTSDKNPSAHRHDGFYLRMSVGGGSLGARGDRYDGYRTNNEYGFRGNAVAFDAMVGGTPARGLAIGGAYLADYAASTDYGTNESSDSGMSLGIIGPFIDWFPNPKTGFHVGGAVGPAVSVSFDDQASTRSIAAGFGGSAWVGYDFWIADQWSLGASLRFQGARVETPNSRELDKDSPYHDRLGVGSASLMLTALYH